MEPFNACYEAAQFVDRELTLLGSCCKIISKSFVSLKLGSQKDYVGVLQILALHLRKVSCDNVEDYLKTVDETNRILNTMSVFIRLVKECFISLECGDIFPSDPYKQHIIKNRIGYKSSKFAPNARQSGKSLNSCEGILCEHQRLEKTLGTLPKGIKKDARRILESIDLLSSEFSTRATSMRRQFCSWEKDTLYIKLGSLPSIENEKGEQFRYVATRFMEYYNMHKITANYNVIDNAELQGTGKVISFAAF